jgi:hypothetical protein
MLACIKHGTTLTINDVRLTNLTAAWIRAEYEGKSLTVKFVEMQRRMFGRKYAADGLEIVRDGFVIPFGLLAEGVTAFIPRKVRKDKGVVKPRNLRKVLGLDQIRADLPPDPKPEEVPAEPAPVEPEPAPVEPKPETVA